MQIHLSRYELEVVLRHVQLRAPSKGEEAVFMECIRLCNVEEVNIVAAPGARQVVLAKIKDRTGVEGNTMKQDGARVRGRPPHARHCVVPHVENSHLEELKGMRCSKQNAVGEYLPMTPDDSVEASRGHRVVVEGDGGIPWERPIDPQYRTIQEAYPSHSDPYGGGIRRSG